MNKNKKNNKNMNTDEEMEDAMKKAYEEAGQNAYFGNGFYAGVKFERERIDTQRNNKRQQAMSWWNSHSSLFKTLICDANTGLLGAVCRWETLTGREIETLYDKYK